jgi:hypothetical protein
VQAWRAAAKERLPEHVAQAARLHLLDAIGVGLAAAGSDVGQPYLRVAAQLAEGKASVFGRASGASAADAALVNGGLIHSLEYDDTHTASIVHGSSVVAATALAVAETSGASGAALLGAYVRGWELLVRIGLAAPGGFQARGFQVTSVGGALAAALVAAELQDLDEQASVAALGISLSQAAGVLEFLSNGSSVKSLHPGWAGPCGRARCDARARRHDRPRDVIRRTLRVVSPVRRQRRRRDGVFRAAGELSARPGTCRMRRSSSIRAAITCIRSSKPPECWRSAAYAPTRPSGSCAACRRALRRSSASLGRSKQAPQTPHAARWSLPIVVAARIARDGSASIRSSGRRRERCSSLPGASNGSRSPARDSRSASRPKSFAVRTTSGSMTCSAIRAGRRAARTCSPNSRQRPALAVGRGRRSARARARGWSAGRRARRPIETQRQEAFMTQNAKDFVLRGGTVVFPDPPAATARPAGRGRQDRGAAAARASRSRKECPSCRRAACTSFPG